MAILISPIVWATLFLSAALCAAAPAVPAAVSGPVDECPIEIGVLYDGESIVAHAPIRDNARDCETLCRNMPVCQAFVYDVASKKCHVKSNQGRRRVADAAIVSGLCACQRLPSPPPPPGSCSVAIGASFSGGAAIWRGVKDHPVACRNACWRKEGCVAFFFDSSTKMCELRNDSSVSATGNHDLIGGVCDKTPSSDCIPELGVDYEDFFSLVTGDVDPVACRDRCQGIADCAAFVFSNSTCRLEPSTRGRIKRKSANAGAEIISGVCGVPKPWNPPPPCGCSLEIGVDFEGADIHDAERKLKQLLRTLARRKEQQHEGGTAHVVEISVEECRDKCLEDHRCHAFVRDGKTGECRLKAEVGKRRKAGGNLVAGVCS